MSAEQQLKDIRQHIDRIDEQLQMLFNQRAELALQVRKIKQDSEAPTTFYRPEREAQIMQNIIARQKGPLSAEQVIAIFRPLLTSCLSLQQPIKVAYLGPEGTFSQIAAQKHFGVETHLVAAKTIEGVFKEIDSGNANYGIVPIENTTTGMINVTLDLLLRSSLLICGEVTLPIHMCFLSSQTDIDKIQKIYGHEQAFLQCRHWLATNYPHIKKITVDSNAAAAQRAMEDPNSAGIAADVAAELYSLHVLAKNIEDSKHNETRFLILGQQKLPASGFDKTTLAIHTPQRSGALVDLIKPFADQGVNLTHIASRPSHSHQWSYVFFIEVEGHQDDSAVKQALSTLTEKSIMLNVLGSYPKAITVTE